MIKQISNNTLLVLISATILVSIIGTWVTITKITPITGAVTGTTNVTVNTTTGISLATALVNFTESTPGESRRTYSTTDIRSGPFNITNDGTVLVNITMSATSPFTSSSFTMPNFRYLYNVSILSDYQNRAFFNCTVGVNSTACCNGYDYAGYRYVKSTTEFAICNLNFTDGKDSVLVHINITIPSDEAAGVKTSVVTFLASAA